MTIKKDTIMFAKIFFLFLFIGVSVSACLAPIYVVSKYLSH